MFRASVRQTSSRIIFNCCRAREWRLPSCDAREQPARPSPPSNENAAPREGAPRVQSRRCGQWYKGDTHDTAEQRKFGLFPKHDRSVLGVRCFDCCTGGACRYFRLLNDAHDSENLKQAQRDDLRFCHQFCCILLMYYTSSLMLDI